MRLWLDKYSVGYALFLVLSSTSAWGLLSFASISQTAFGGVSGIETIRSIGYIGTLALFGIGCLIKRSLFDIDTKTPAAACFVAGFLLLAYWTMSNTPTNSVTLIAAFLIGIGASLSFIVWQRIFAGQAVEDAERRIIAGSALSALFYMLVSFIGDFRFYVSVLFVLVVLNWVFMKLCSGTVFEGKDADSLNEGSTVNSLRGLLSSTWRYMLCIAAIGYVAGVSRILAQQGGYGGLLLSISLAVGMFTAAVLLMVFWGSFKRSGSFRLIYTILFFLVSIGFFFVPFVPISYRLIFAGVANAAFSIASIFMTITCIRMARARNMDPIAVFGIFAAIVYGGVLVGRIIGDAVSNSVDIIQIMVVVLMSIYILSFAGILINYRKREKDVDTHESFMDGTQTENTEDEELVRDETLAPKQKHRLEQQVLVMQDGIPPLCEEMKQTYSLTNRETDVLELILRGRDVAHMAEALYVSENTVRTHSKRLYRKLDVHNRQQLLDLAEEHQVMQPRGNTSGKA